MVSTSASVFSLNLENKTTASGLWTMLLSPRMFFGGPDKPLDNDWYSSGKGGMFLLLRLFVT